MLTTRSPSLMKSRPSPINAVFKDFQQKACVSNRAASINRIIDFSIVGKLIANCLDN